MDKSFMNLPENITIDFFTNGIALNEPAAAELVDFWLLTKALADRETAQTRLVEVVAIARYKGGIAAVMSGYQAIHELIAQPLFHLRSFVSEDFRRSGLALTLLMAVRERFEKRFENDSPSAAIGLCLSLESKELLSAPALRQGVWQRSGFVFVGRNSSGREQRVYYFSGATLR